MKFKIGDVVRFKKGKMDPRPRMVTGTFPGDTRVENWYDLTHYVGSARGDVETHQSSGREAELELIARGPGED